MSVTATQRADSLIMWWTRRLVRGLPAPAAADRVAEISSDLWEQRNADPRSEAQVARSMVLRGLRGVPDDLLWRRSIRVAAAEETPKTMWADRSRGTIMTKKHHPAAKPWIHLDGIAKPFDQTNGAVSFDTPDKHDSTDVEGDIMAAGVASNIVTAGYFGV